LVTFFTSVSIELCRHHRAGQSLLLGHWYLRNYSAIVIGQEDSEPSPAFIPCELTSKDRRMRCCFLPRAEDPPYCIPVLPAVDHMEVVSRVLGYRLRAAIIMQWAEEASDVPERR
jgi:hypothetical protein